MNIDFVALIFQVCLNAAILLGLGIYLYSTYSWETNSKQEEEAAKQFHQMRANLKTKQATDTGEENSVQESLLPRDQSAYMRNIMGSTQLFDITAIAPNATQLHGVNANVRQQQRNFMQDTINLSSARKFPDHL